jgi:hypothetical protein
MRTCNGENCVFHMWCNFYSHECNYDLTSFLWKSLPFTMFAEFEGIKFEGVYFFSH